MTGMTEEALLTAPEVAERLNVPVSWVYSAAREKRLPCVPNMGRYVRFRPEDVAAFRENRTSDVS